MKSGKLKKTLLTLGGVLFWAAVWEALALIVGKEILLPTVGQTLAAFGRAALTGEFALSVLLSFLRISAGLAAGCVFGALCAIGSYASPVIKAIFSPLMRVFRATPVASVIILALVWLKASFVPSLAVTVMAAPILYASVLSGLEAVDGKMLEMTRLYGLSTGKRVRTLYLPSLVPHLRASVTTAVGLGWKAGVAAEVIARPLYALGTSIYNTKLYLETAELFAVTLVVVLVSVLLEKLTARLIGRKEARP